jgi:hypothetical protein
MSGTGKPREALSTRSADSKAAATTGWSTSVRPGRSSSSAILSASACGSGTASRTSLATSASRSRRPAKPSRASAADGRVARTRCPFARAVSTATRQSVVFPMPASPASNTAAGPSPSPSANALSASCSRFRPITSDAAATVTPARAYAPPRPGERHRTPPVQQKRRMARRAARLGSHTRGLGGCLEVRRRTDRVGSERSPCCRWRAGARLARHGLLLSGVWRYVVAGRDGVCCVTAALLAPSAHRFSIDRGRGRRRPLSGGIRRCGGPAHCVHDAGRDQSLDGGGRSKC